MPTKDFYDMDGDGLVSEAAVWLWCVSCRGRSTGLRKSRLGFTGIHRDIISVGKLGYRYNMAHESMYGILGSIVVEKCMWVCVCRVMWAYDQDCLGLAEA